MATYETFHQDVLQALGDPTRRRIVEVLAEGEKTVGEITDVVPVSRPAVSQHLKTLLEANLVAYRSRGTSHVYRLESAGFEALRHWLDGFWEGVLGAFEYHARRVDRKGKT